MSKQQYYIPALAKIHQGLGPYARLLLRVLVGSIFIFHGYGKLMAVVSGPGLGEFAAAWIEPSGLPFPIVLAHLALITEVVGGICIILGLFTRVWALTGAGMMYLIIFFIRDPSVFRASQGGIEFDLTLAVIFTVLFIKGAGDYSLDAKMKKVF